jgi:hypothetical protein
MKQSNSSTSSYIFVSTMSTFNLASFLLVVLLLAHVNAYADPHDLHHGHEADHVDDDEEHNEHEHHDHSSGPNKRAASCDIDASIECECTNPFLGTDNFFLGDPKQNCKAAKACYVKNLSGCSDARQSRGGGRCQSKEACDDGKAATPPTGVDPTPAPSKPKCPAPAVGK